MLQALARDLHHAARALLRAPSYTFVCVVSLWIGMAPVIAATRGVRVFDVPARGIDPRGLVEVITTRQGAQEPSDVWSYPDYQDLKTSVSALTLSGWARGRSETRVQTPGGSERRTLDVMYVDADYLPVMKASLALGAGFDARDAGPQVVLTHAFWRTREQGDPNIIGRTITLDGVPHTIVGVGQEHFHGHLSFEGVDVFLPLAREPRLMGEARGRLDRRDNWVHLHGRLGAGQTIARADAAVLAATTQLARAYPSPDEPRLGTVRPFHPTGNLFATNLLLIKTVVFTLTGFVLLVVCANLGGMMQVRSAMREREMSIRQSLGASRTALMRYLLAESTILAGIGGALASLLLFNIPPLLAWFADGPLPYQLEQALRVDVSAVLTCAGLCLLASLFFGLLPAMRFSRPAILSSLKDDAGGGGLRVGRVHRFTAALQIAIAVPLLVMGGISLDRVRSTATSDLGFTSDLLYAAPLPLEPTRDPSGEIRRAMEQLAGASTVASVTVADGLPLDFRYRMQRIALVGPEGPPRWIQTHVTRVGDHYLETMGIQVTRGRDFVPEDRAGSELVTVIARPLADVLSATSAPGDLIGQQLLYGSDEKTQKRLTIVGVTSEFPTSQMSTERAQLLLPLAQHADVRADTASIGDDIDISPRLMLVARSAPGAPADGVVTALENVVRERDPSFTRAAIVTGTWLRRNSMNDFLTQTGVAAVTGTIILTLAALGVYGVVGLMVATRTKELAVRIALGATRLRVITLVLGDVVRLAAPGIGAGLLLAVALIRLNSENMGVPLSGVENVAYLAGGGAALLVALAASLVPARRAASIQPIKALKGA